VPGIYVALLCDVMERLGHDAGRVTEGLGVSRPALLAPDSRVSMITAYSAAARAVELAGHQGLGLEYARALRVTLHGSVGMVAMSSPTVSDALSAAARYITLRAPFLDIDYRHEGGFGEVSARLRLPIPELETFIMEAFLVGLAFMGEQLTGGEATDAEIRMPGAEPDYYADYAPRLPVPIHYGASRCVLRFPAGTTEAVPQLADPEVARLAREQCELEFREYFGEREQLPDLIRQHILAREEGVPSLGQMADLLHMSDRTLKRRLQDEGVRYRDLLEQALCEKAERLLADPNLPISEVAWRLGYNDVSNFSRAFKRWSGHSPRQWRSAHPDSDDDPR
jgi:AraC-like DNA-binding protein